MNFVHIPEKKIVQDIPSCVEELSNHQYLRFVELLDELEEGNISFESFKMKFSVELVSLKTDISFYFRSKSFKEAVYYNLLFLGELAEDFFKEEVRDGKKVKVALLSFVRQMIPNLGDYYGP